MRIGLLQTGHLPGEIQAEMGDYPEFYGRFLAPEGVDLTTWAVVDGVFPDSVAGVDGWLVGGSRHGAYEDLPWITQLEAFVREAYGAGVPMVGICFGHQLIGQALGGHVEKFAGGWAVGHHEYDWSGETVPLNAWHQDQLTRLPEDGTRIATSDFCENAAVTYGPRAFTVQAHPEFGADAIHMLIRTRGRGMIDDRVLDRAEQTLDRPVANARLARMIAGFYETGVPHA